MKSFPSSTCVECGRPMPGGQVQKCNLTPSGFCSWHIPNALAAHIAEINAEYAELVNALQGMLAGVAKGNHGSEAQREIESAVVDSTIDEIEGSAI